MTTAATAGRKKVLGGTSQTRAGYRTWLPGAGGERLEKGYKFAVIQ